MLKEVSKEKPAQAPRHPSTEEAFKKLLKGIVSFLGIRAYFKEFFQDLTMLLDSVTTP